jgi:hypothetical protein
MLMTLPLLVALSLAPGQAGGLTLTEPRLTHGQLGPARAGTKVLPGDTLFLAFDIEGISADADGKPTLARPFAGTIDKDVPGGDTALPIQFHVGLNRPGRFTVEVKATDVLAGKTVTQSFPLTVHPVK